ncbi:ZIP family metal transporter [Patescibacteria group bacterium]|nr:ZIP family metal transporter [Patescibacteria group bacterium]
MVTIYLYAFSSVIIISLISLIGIMVLSLRKELLQKSIFLIVSLAIGALFGGALIHLIPEAFEKIENSALVSLLIISGILSFLVLEKFLMWHHCHGHGSNEDHTGDNIKPLGFLVIISDGIHNLVDGIIIGASYLISIEVGIAATIAVILHEIPQEISDFGLLIHAGFTKMKALAINFATALLAIVGVGIAFVLGGNSEIFTPAVLAFAAGGFIYISGSDLVPEIHKISDLKRSSLQLFMILVGIGLMFALLLLEI